MLNIFLYKIVDNFLDNIDILINQYDEIRDKIDYNFLSSNRCFSEYEDIILKLAL